MTIGIVGLGLMGGSLAKALHGFMDSEIIGFDRKQSVLERALREGVIQRGETDLAMVSQCGLVVFAINPRAEMDVISQCAFQKGAVVTDLCGVKCFLDAVPKELDFVAGHPMAGKEVSGYPNSDGKLFFGANYLLVPRETTSDRAVALVTRMAKYIGCGRVMETTARTHDQMIAFTSQMPHVLAGCIVNTPYYNGCNGFEGGSLADFTRIACLDETMWSELFLLNREKLVPVLTNIQENLKKVTEWISGGNEEALKAYLQKARIHREEHE